MFLPPTIPDLDQLEEITLEDAVNLLLKSIAMEEISLSKLMDAERSKVLCALNHCKCGTGTLRDVLEINRSAEDMMKTIIQLQMLLRFKLKNVQELLPCPALPCLLPKRGSTCCMRGTGKGCVQNREDTFYHCPASIYAFLPCGNSQNGTIRYIVGNNCDGLYLYACDRNVRVRCREGCSDQIVVYGEGRIRKCSARQPEQTGTVSFHLTVTDREGEVPTFRMVLTSTENLSFEHDSGWVKIDWQDSDLHMKICD